MGRGETLTVCLIYALLKKLSSVRRKIDASSAFRGKHTHFISAELETFGGQIGAIALF